MQQPFQRIGLLGRHGDPRVMGPMNALAEHLSRAKVEIVTADAIDLPVAQVPETELAAEVDLIIAIGGDGTMLYAASVVRGRDVPLLGVNRGRLGFLADITPDEMLASVDHVLAGEFVREQRLTLTAVLTRPDGTEVSADALNDIVLQRRETGRMVDFETRVAGGHVNIRAGDGLIVATPTGSTAYSLSCGGPIVQPGLRAVVMVPICPHTLTDRPIVLPCDEPIDVRMLERDDIKAEVTADGRAIGAIHAADRLRISESTTPVTLIHPPGYDYYEILRSKLYWGRDLRARGSGRPEPEPEPLLSRDLRARGSGRG